MVTASEMRASRWSGLLLTQVSVKSELLLKSKRCPNFRVGHVCTGTIVRSLVLLERRERLIWTGTFQGLKAKESKTVLRS